MLRGHEHERTKLLSRRAAVAELERRGVRTSPVTLRKLVDAHAIDPAHQEWNGRGRQDYFTHAQVDQLAGRRCRADGCDAFAGVSGYCEAHNAIARGGVPRPPHVRGAISAALFQGEVRRCAGPGEGRACPDRVERKMPPTELELYKGRPYRCIKCRETDEVRERRRAALFARYQSSRLRAQLVQPFAAIGEEELAERVNARLGARYSHAALSRARISAVARRLQLGERIDHLWAYTPNDVDLVAREILSWRARWLQTVSGMAKARAEWGRLTKLLAERTGPREKYTQAEKARMLELIAQGQGDTAIAREITGERERRKAAGEWLEFGGPLDRLAVRRLRTHT